MSFTAKSIILDIADNYSDSYIGLRSLEMKLASVLQAITAGDISATYGTEFAVSTKVDFAFITGLTKTGNGGNAQWLNTMVASNVRIICVFVAPQTFDELVVNNYHNTGTLTGRGGQNVKITISDDAISDLTYNAPVSNSTVIFDSVFPEHSAVDAADDQVLTLVQPPIVITPPAFITTTTLNVASVTTSPIVITPPAFIMGTELTAGVAVAINPPAFVTGTELFVSGTALFSREFSSIFYIFTLTGSPDIEIPISNFQTRLRDGDPSYLQVTVPDADRWMTAITARTGGEMRIDMAFKLDGEFIRRDTIAVADLEQIDPVAGAISQSIILSGHKTETFSPKEITVPQSNAVTRAISQGALSYRLAAPDVNMKPGDLVTVGIDTFTARIITYFISVDSQFQTVNE